MLDRAQESVSGPQTLKLADGYYLLGETDKAARAYLDFLEHEQVSSALRDVLRVKLTDIYLQIRSSACRGAIDCHGAGESGECWRALFF